jgi:succinoglycan biosynthesis protein ExoM
VRVVVGIATRGDRDLAPLVAALRGQSRAPVRVLVATQGGSPGVVRSVPGQAPVTVLPVRGSGFSRGRNVLLRYLRLTAAHWDVAAFLDDDEHPHPDWLDAHLRTMAEHDGDVCLGPVRRLWPASAPRAVRRADLPHRPDCPEGDFDGDGRTGNYALRSGLLARTPTVFDERLGRSGGEDTAFFRALRDAGARLVWSPRAVVEEEVTAAQCRPGAVVRRSYRNGRTLPLLVALGHGRGGTARTLGQEWRRLPKALLLALAGLGGRRGDQLLRGAWEAAYLVGLVAGLLLDRPRPAATAPTGAAGSGSPGPGAPAGRRPASPTLLPRRPGRSSPR